MFLLPINETDGRRIISISIRNHQDIDVRRKKTNSRTKEENNQRVYKIEK